MKITLLPSSLGVGEGGTTQYLTSFVINDSIAIDAGSLGFFRSPLEQAKIRHVLLSHSHIDHIASLPIFLENAYGLHSGVVHVHASEPVLDCLRKDVFNDRVWPDFIRLSNEGTAFLHVASLTPRQALTLDGLRITPVEVNHVVPTLGYIVEDKHSAVVISGDTGPTEEIWNVANELPHLKAVCLEVTFPNSMAWLAELTKHHTPQSFGAEARKIRRPVTFLAYHLKPRYAVAVASEMQSLGLPDCAVMQPDKPYTF